MILMSTFSGKETGGVDQTNSTQIKLILTWIDIPSLSKKTGFKIFKLGTKT